MKIAWFGKHFGEEPPISGDKGSGTIFFPGCNLHCCFCQNWQISQQWLGKEYSVEELVDIMLKLQDQGALNINLVSPTIWVFDIKQAIVMARQKGLTIPIVYNTNAYDKLEDIKSLKGLIDIYLPDYKYGDDNLGIKYSRCINYSKVAQKNILEMLDQVGEDNIIVRHLVIPNNLDNTFEALKTIRFFSPNICLSLMIQYNPLYQAKNYPEINRKLSKDEYERVMQYVEQLDFQNGYFQPWEENASEVLIPDFSKPNPFV